MESHSAENDPFAEGPSGRIDTDNLPISFLLPVYHAVTPQEFQRAYRSLANQTAKPNEIIVVLDGPVEPEIETYLALQPKQLLTIVRFEHNQGIAAAMEAGFAVARNRWIARHDADDIALPRRLELQWPIVRTAKYAAVGGAILEFVGNPENVVRVRSLPRTPKAINRYVRINSPLNNQSTIFDREAVRAVGGTRPLPRLEDYDLFARLIAGNFRLRSIEDPIVLVHAADSMYERRTDRALFASEWRMQRNLVEYGLIPAYRAPLNYLVRQIFRMLPRPLLKFAYAKLFDRGARGMAATAREWTLAEQKRTEPEPAE